MDPLGKKEEGSEIKKGCLNTKIYLILIYSYLHLSSPYPSVLTQDDTLWLMCSGSREACSLQ